jgi:geranylgeranyl reductase family protein
MCLFLEVYTMKHDAVVIGAGPAGLLAATKIAADGHDVIVFEEHPVIGEPNHCAGLLSVSGLRSLGLSPPNEVIQNHVEGARIFAPSGDSILVRRGRREALVVDRPSFDRWLSQRAVDHGAEIVTESKVTGVMMKRGHVIGVRSKRGNASTEHVAKVTVNAEGARCQISREVGLPAVPRTSKLPAYQYELAGAEIEDDMVEMFYGQRVAPGFFAWIIPLGDSKARIGLAARTRTRDRLDNLLRHHPAFLRRFHKATIQQSYGGTVLVGMPVRKTYLEGLMVVGDAAGHVKPTTGGGVVVGGLAARIAGVTASSIISSSNPNISYFRQFERRWRSIIFRELQTMYIAQKALTSLTDKGIDLLVSRARAYGLVETIETFGDMDRQKRVIMSLLKDPRMFLLGLNALRHVCPVL